jgi:hypothetical protein
MSVSVKLSMQGQPKLKQEIYSVLNGYRLLGRGDEW